MPSKTQKIVWILLLLAAPAALRAEQCVAGVHAMAPWTRSIRGNAFEMAVNAAKLAFLVDHTPQNGAILAYPPNYGRGINAKYGHVALLVDIRPDKDGKILIKDSNGICGGNRLQCRVRTPVWKNVLIIHRK